MPDSPISDHITKEAAAKYVKRSYRALGRDLTAALKSGDADVLQHWKLSTKDGGVRNGLDMTVEMVTQLRGLVGGIEKAPWRLAKELSF